MILYHFTSLYALPSIQREGLTKGEVPVSENERATGPNLTGSGNPFSQHWREGSVVNKAMVRITVELDQADTRLKNWRNQVWRGGNDARKLLDPYGQGKFWWIYFGIIPTSAFRKVELLDGGGY